MTTIANTDKCFISRSLHEIFSLPEVEREAPGCPPLVTARGSYNKTTNNFPHFDESTNTPLGLAGWLAGWIDGCPITTALDFRLTLPPKWPTQYTVHTEQAGNRKDKPDASQILGTTKSETKLDKAFQWRNEFVNRLRRYFCWGKGAQINTYD